MKIKYMIYKCNSLLKLHKNILIILVIIVIINNMIKFNRCVNYIVMFIII